jgi:hypothetical protein
VSVTRASSRQRQDMFVTMCGRERPSRWEFQITGAYAAVAVLASFSLSLPRARKALPVCQKSARLIPAGANGVTANDKSRGNRNSATLRSWMREEM